jgi:hypothetical protein
MAREDPAQPVVGINAHAAAVIRKGLEYSFPS